MVISVNTEDVVDDLDKLREQYELLDFSNLNIDHKLFSNEYRKIPGYMKTETPKG